MKAKFGEQFWRFDTKAAESKARNMSTVELRAALVRHINYIPGSSYTLIYHRELQRRQQEED